jgi:S-adenosylmethionine hydrolase
MPKLRYERARIRGEVIAVDHFGNVVTSIGRLFRSGDQLALHAAFADVEPFGFSWRTSRVIVAGTCVGPIRSTYGSVGEGEALGLVGSTGMLEIAVNQGHGASVLGLAVGDPVVVRIDS